MVQEIIRKVDKKPDEFYWCEELHREPGYLVLGYDVRRDRHLGPVPIPAGSRTIAHYWEDRGYVLWEMLSPERDLIGHCYHLCLPPVIRATTVEYLDLLLDLWFDPQGNLTVLDEEELAAAEAAGQIGETERRFIACAREAIAEGHAAILAGLWRPGESG
jgi:hypothetical protein